MLRESRRLFSFECYLSMLGQKIYISLNDSIYKSLLTIIVKDEVLSLFRFHTCSSRDEHPHLLSAAVQSHLKFKKLKVLFLGGEELIQVCPTL